MITLPTLSVGEHAAFVAVGLLAYVVLTRVRRQKRHPYAALAWVVGIAAFPYLGLPLFLLFGSRKLVRPATPRAPAPREAWAAFTPRWATQLLAAMGLPGPRPTQDLRFQADGAEALDTLLGLMGSARETLDVCTYVLGDDEVGAQVARALAERARAGVQVRLLIDAIGSLKSAHSHDALLKAAGVQTQLFMPALRRRRGRTNLRNHRKLVVADGQRVWGGGRNLANEYFIGRPGEAPWIDLSFTAEGVLAREARRIFDGDWRLGIARASQVLGDEDSELPDRPTDLGDSEWQMSEPTPLVPAAAAAPAFKALLHSQPHVVDQRAPDPSDPATRPTLAQWVASGPDYHEDTLHALLLSATFHAERRLLLAAPYFVPDEALLEGLLLAIKRGVAVTLVLPRRSNHRLTDLARGRAVRELVEAGANVRLVPGMMHAKAVVVDDALALCGSANLDSRSLFINYEAMAAFYGEAPIAWLATWMEALAATGEPASAKAPSWWREMAEGIIATVAFQL